MDMDRRAFGVASLSAVAALAQAPDRKIGYAIVGLGRISLDHFMPACKMSRLSQVTALVTGHREKADKAALEYNVPASSIYSYEDFDKIAKNPAVDAVYIALPNSMHAEYTIRAAKAGKHVLCEKPMATTVADSKAMIAACAKAKVKLMIAYRCQYEPTHARAKEIIRSGRLGTLQSIESANGQLEKAGEWRLNRKLAGGGPLPDVGIYSLNACRYLSGEEPTEIQGNVSVIDRDGRFSEVEENCAWSMKFASGLLASCSTTYGAKMPGTFRIHGSKGMLHMEPAFAYQGLRLKLDITGEPPVDDPTSEKDPYQFLLEADHFSNCVLGNKEPKSNGEEGLRDMELMGKIYRSAGVRGW